MNLKCKINGKEYPIVQGNTFSDEFNETLDSGSIIISQVEKIKNIKQYDDVYIYDNEFNGYENREEEINLINEIKFILTEQEEQEGISRGNWIYLELSDKFMRTLFSGNLVKYSLKIDFIEIDEDNVVKEDFCDCYITYENNIYYFYVPKLKIKEILTESSDTQGLWVFQRGEYFTEKYDVIKVIEANAKEFYHSNKNNNSFYKHLLIDKKNKETLRLESEEKNQYVILLMSETKRLETIPLPNFSITQPLDITFKKSIYDYIVDVIEMYSPIYKVVDNSESKSWKYQRKYTVDPNLKNIFGNTYSPDFTLNNPNLRDVLSQLMKVKDMIPYVEDDMIKAMDITQRKGDFSLKGVNFIKSNQDSENYCTSLKRTYSDALSEQKSCRLTEFLSFRNSNTGALTLDNMSIETTYPIYKVNKMYMCYYKKIEIQSNTTTDVKNKVFLCKQDISKLVKLNAERNVLSEDWNYFNSQIIKSVDDLSKFKLGTVGYDIGSKSITGWGNKYTSYALFNWFPQANTYIQKIFEFMDDIYPYGIYNYSYLREKLNLKNNEFPRIFKGKESFISPFENEYPAGLKSLFFEIEYESFYNGTIYHSKDNLDRDDIVINDNSSSSLTLIEQDGIMQKEKINRFGNEIFQFNARYKDVSEIQELGSVYNSKDGEDTDIIIYSREYSIQDNVVNCRYIGAKDYVLKNYFTSVYAKHRPYNLMSYGESVYRSENKMVYLMMDFDKKYIEKNKDVLVFKNFGDDLENGDYKSFGFFKKAFSFVNSTEVEQKNNFLNKDKINYGYYVVNDKKYASDVNVFTSANSLCFNLKMYDNVSAGVYVDVNNLEPDFQLFDVKDDVVGSLQDWYLTVDNEKTGFLEKIGFYVGHNDKNSYILEDGVFEIDEIIGKKEKNVVALNSQIIDNTLKPGNEIEIKTINVLKNDTVFKKIFELPKIDVKNNDFKNLIGNEYLLKKDNKELIDMTFQIEPITNNDKILFSPWTMKLSDLNGVYGKFSKPIYVADDNNFNIDDSSKKAYFKTIELIKPTKTNNDGTQNFPIMILSIKNQNLNSQGDASIINLEDSLRDKGLVETSINFSYNNTDKNHTPMTDNRYTVKWLMYDFNKIISYNKEENYIELEGTQQIFYNIYKWYDLLEVGKLRQSNDRVVLKFKKIDSIEENPLAKPAEGETWFAFDTRNQQIFIPYKKADYKIEYECGNGKYLTNNYDINESTANINDSYFVGANSFIYNQNMFVTTSNEPMKKYHVYNQYKDLREIGLSDYNTGPLVSDVFYFVEDDKLVVDLYNFEHKKDEVKSVQLWYRDEGGALNFVFGVNVDEEDFNKRRLEIHISLITHKDMRVFDKFHNVIGEVKNVANSEDVDDLTKQKYEKYIEK